MDKLKRIITLLVLVPVGILLIVLAVANRQTVTLALNPFRPQDAVIALSAPFFLFLFAALLIGMLIGAAVTWFGQGRYRRRARIEAREAVKWKNEHNAAVATRPTIGPVPSTVAPAQMPPQLSAR